MAFRPNYGMQRSDRNRAAQARRDEKLRKREKKIGATQGADVKVSPGDAKVKIRRDR
jgi:hypothetical protein